MIHLFKSTHEKANKRVQKFMQVHAKRIEAEGALATVNNEGEIPEKIKNFMNSMASELITLHKIESKKYSEKEVDLKALYNLQKMHHPDILKLANVGMKNDVPIYTGDSKEVQQFALDLYQFIHVNRQQYLFNLATNAHTTRLDMEKKLTDCNREAVPRICQEIQDAIEAERNAIVSYADYINYEAEKPLKPAWNFFDGQYHHHDLIALGTEADPVPKLPLTNADVERRDYHEMLERFIVRKRFIEKPQSASSTATATSDSPSQSAGTSSHPLQQSTTPPLSKGQVFIGWMNKIAKHAVTHTLLTVCVSRFYATTWSTVALYGLGTMIFSLGFQMLRQRLIEHWIKQAILKNSLFSDPGWQAQGYRTGYISEKSYIDYIKGWFHPSAYCLPAYYLGRYTASQNLPVETRLNTAQIMTPNPILISEINLKSGQSHPLKI